MHLITEEQRKYLETLPLKKRQKEILKDEYRNGEWYVSDIRDANARNLPKSDCWCFGAPCQDFSVAGKRAGLDGDRSSLIREIFRLLEEQEEQDRPEWLIYENVKGMLSSNRGLDYLSILSEMDRLGYDIEWQNINSKWFVPQNRERIYTIGHLRRCGSRKVLPITGADGENRVSIMGHRNGYHRNMQTFSPDGITEALSTCQGGGREHHVGIKIIGTTQPHMHSTGDIHDIEGIAPTCLGRDYKQPKQVAIPVLTPDRIKKRQNGRRFKEDGDPMFTLTTQDRHGVGIGVRYTENGFHLYRKNKKKSTIQGTHVTCQNGNVQCLGTSHIPMTMEKIGIIDPQGRNKKKVSIKDICPTLRSETHGNVPNVCVNVNEDSNYGNGIYVEMPEGFVVYALWYEKYGCYIVIRKLTPKECFRLQGWTDDYFEKAAFVNSDSQLYKQAGNGVTVDVVKVIGERIVSSR